jgi:hypothetical protein
MFVIIVGGEYGQFKSAVLPPIPFPLMVPLMVQLRIAGTRQTFRLMRLPALLISNLMAYCTTGVPALLEYHCQTASQERPAFVPTLATPQVGRGTG